MPSINICCLVIMFYLTKKSCSFDVLKIWKYNFLLVLLADLVRGCGDGMARQRESREGFLCPARGTGHSEKGYPPRLHEKVIQFDDDIPNRKSGMKTVCGTRFLCPRWSSSPRTDPSSSASPGLNRRAHWAVSAIVSLASHPFLCIPELDTIQWMKNSTFMNHNKCALSHLVFFSLFPPNANDCVCSC